MDDGQRDAIRTALEMQFRYKFYQDTTFPYLQSMGIQDVFQGFGNDEEGFIGMLHLWWVPEDSNIHYDNPKNWPVKIIGIWKGEWFDTPEEGIALADKIEQDRNKVYDTRKLIELHIEYAKSIAQKQMKKQIEEKTEDTPKKKILWN